jgi:hypothetical protein
MGEGLGNRPRKRFMGEEDPVIKTTIGKVTNLKLLCKILFRKIDKPTNCLD